MRTPAVLLPTGQGWYLTPLSTVQAYDCHTDTLLDILRPPAAPIKRTTQAHKCDLQHGQRWMPCHISLLFLHYWTCLCACISSWLAGGIQWQLKLSHRNKCLQSILAVPSVHEHKREPQLCVGTETSNRSAAKWLQREDESQTGANFEHKIQGLVHSRLY